MVHVNSLAPGSDNPTFSARHPQRISQILLGQVRGVFHRQLLADERRGIPREIERREPGATAAVVAVAAVAASSVVASSVASSVAYM
jgi:hypothetical protein